MYEIRGAGRFDQGDAATARHGRIRRTPETYLEE
jgi:hypothetical protein